MWLIYVLVGLALLVVGGLYARRRIAGALTYLGVPPRPVRIVRWAMAWLLFAYPVLLIRSVAVTLALGRTTLVRFDGKVGTWLVAYPFAWATLVVVQSLLWLLAIDLAHAAIRRARGDAAAARVRAIAVLVVVGVFAIYTPARILAERGDLRVREHQVGVDTPSVPPFRIAFVADVQQDEHTDAARAREVYAIVNASAPDLVLSGGDWINTGPEHIEAAAETAAMLESRLGVFTVRGDHEHFAYFDRERSVAEVEAAMRRHGIEVIDDDVRWFEHHGKRIAVVFLGYHYVKRADRATIARLVDAVASADYSIVVTHQLDAALVAQLRDRVDLVLAAHTHGGQVNPVIGLWHVPLARIETELVDGRYQLGSTTVIVTAGVGTSIIPIRYAAPGSIELIRLDL